MTDGMSEYLKFVQLETPPERKTKLISVVSKSSNIELGKIGWWGPWRQYTFSPSDRTIFNINCMNDIIGKIKELMLERAEFRAAK